MHRTRTKIVATLGPVSQSRQVIDELVTAGVDVFRFNMSHGTHDDHQGALDALRAVADQCAAHVAVIVDLCGPKVRTGEMDADQSKVERGQSCVIVRETSVGNAEAFTTNHPELIDDVEVGHRIMIDDGQIRLRVVEKEADRLVCTCEVGGPIGSRKGVNLPDSTLSLPPLTEKDFADLSWAVENEADYIAQSFVRRASDLEAVRESLGSGSIPVISKIETPEAINRLDEIIDASDAVLVARGDLGVELDVWRIPMLQKDIVRRCRRAGKPVIIATQMLHSMVHQPTPTRAEVSDAANAVLDGADALMLSAESAVGRYPVESVEMLDRVIRQVETDTGSHPQEAEGAGQQPWFMRADPDAWVGRGLDATTAAVARSAVLVAHDLHARVIAVWCRTGRTIQWISKYQAPQKLVGLTTSSTLCRCLSLLYGVDAMPVESVYDEAPRAWHEVRRRIAERYALGSGDVLVVVGDPAAPTRAPTLSIHVVGAAE